MTIWRVLKLDEMIYPEIAKNNLTFKYCFRNVFILGVLYGLFSVYNNSEAFSSITQTASLLISQGIVFIAGITIAFLLHAGASATIWVFTRGIGGNTNFLLTYFNVGVSLVPLWLATPGLTAILAGVSNPFILAYTSLTGVLSFLSIFTATKSASGLPLLKMSVAMTITIIFVACFLYLWI